MLLMLLHLLPIYALIIHQYTSTKNKHGMEFNKKALVVHKTLNDVAQDQAKSKFINRMLSTTNKHRKDSGKKELIIHKTLNDVAQDQANYNCTNRILSHISERRETLQERLLEGGFGGSSIAENIAKQEGGEYYNDVYDVWMKSDTHRLNIIGDYQYTGIGTCKDNKKNRYYVQVFGKIENKNNTISKEPKFSGKEFQFGKEGFIVIVKPVNSSINSVNVDPIVSSRSDKPVALTCISNQINCTEISSTININSFSLHNKLDKPDSSSSENNRDDELEADDDNKAKFLLFPHRRKKDNAISPMPNINKNDYETITHTSTIYETVTVSSANSIFNLKKNSHKSNLDNNPKPSERTGSLETSNVIKLIHAKKKHKNTKSLIVTTTPESKNPYNSIDGLVDGKDGMEKPLTNDDLIRKIPIYFDYFKKFMIDLVNMNQNLSPNKNQENHDKIPEKYDLNNRSPENGIKYKSGNGVGGIPFSHFIDLLGSENVLKSLPKKIHPPIKDRKDLPLKQKELGANLKVEIA